MRQRHLAGVQRQRRADGRLGRLHAAASTRSYEELSTDGGATWSTGVDKQITTTNPIEGAERHNAADCLLNNGGSAFRCNSFPSLAGDPNSADAGGTAFVVVWADVRSTTQN